MEASICFNWIEVDIRYTSPFITDKSLNRNKKAEIPKRISASNTCVRGFEPPTFWSVAKRSIQLSYAHIIFKDMPQTGIEPVREYKSRRILSPVRLPVPPLRHNGTNRARTCDPLLVRQVLSQLSYDPMGY